MFYVLLDFFKLFIAKYFYGGHCIFLSPNFLDMADLVRYCVPPGTLRNVENIFMLCIFMAIFNFHERYFLYYVGMKSCRVICEIFVSIALQALYLSTLLN